MALTRRSRTSAIRQTSGADSRRIDAGSWRNLGWRPSVRPGLFTKTSVPPRSGMNQRTVLPPKSAADDRAQRRRQMGTWSGCRQHVICAKRDACRSYGSQ